MASSESRAERGARRQARRQAPNARRSTSTTTIGASLGGRLGDERRGREVYRFVRRGKAGRWPNVVVVVRRPSCQSSRSDDGLVVRSSSSPARVQPLSWPLPRVRGRAKVVRRGHESGRQSLGAVQRGRLLLSPPWPPQGGAAPRRSLHAAKALIPARRRQASIS